MLDVAPVRGRGRALRPAALRGLGLSTAVAAALAVNAVVVVVLVRKSVVDATLVAALPLLAFAVGGLVQRTGALVFVALALPLSTHALNVSHGGLWAADVIVVLAVGFRLANRLVAGRRMDASSVADRPFWPRLPTTGLLLLLFAGPMFVATYRGHQQYGIHLVGEPMRFVIYAGIVCAVADLRPRTLYRGIVVVYYLATPWMLLNAAYFLVAGGSQTTQSQLSTGGTRLLSGSVAMYMAAALILALLNLEFDTNSRRRPLHLAVAVLAGIAVILAETRAVYVGLLLPMAVIFLRHRLRKGLISVLPLLLPFLILGGIAEAEFRPSLPATFIRRITTNPTNDPNVLEREQMSSAVIKQFRSEPLWGVGFGRVTHMTINLVSPSSGLEYTAQMPVLQDAHDGYLYLLAGGGLFAFVPFVLLLGAYALNVRRLLRRAVDPFARPLLLWSSLSLVVILVAAAAGPVLGGASDLLVVWTLLSVPAAVVTWSGRSEPS